MASNTLTGTTGNDILNAPGSVETEVLGLEGNDTLSLVLSGDIGKAGQGDDSILVNVDGSAKASVYGGKYTQLLEQSSPTRLHSGFEWQRQHHFGELASPNNGAFVSGNAGDDSITVSAAATLVTAGGGQGSDVITFQAGGTSSDVQGGKGKDSITLVGTFTGSTIGGSNGFDTIRATGFTGTTSLLGGGKGGDSIVVGTGAICNPRRRLSERHHYCFWCLRRRRFMATKTAKQLLAPALVLKPTVLTSQLHCCSDCCILLYLWSRWCRHH